MDKLSLKNNRQELPDIYEFADIYEMLRRGGHQEELPDSSIRIVSLDNVVISDLSIPAEINTLTGSSCFKAASVLCIHDASVADCLLTNGYFSSYTESAQYIYNGPALDLNKIRAACRGTDADTQLLFRVLSLSDYPVLHELSSESSEYLKNRLQAGALTGLYLNGALCGFVGLHNAGSMGFLQVLPEYRRRGFAGLLLAQLINNQLSCGAVPFGHVVTGNTASEQLLASFGFIRCSLPAIWLSKS